jgi:hypothetical protein
VAARIGLGRKASSCSQWPGYWQEKQCGGSPEAALPQTAGSDADHPRCPGLQIRFMKMPKIATLPRCKSSR